MVGVIERYREFMPEAIQKIPKSKIVTLEEGNTPLTRAKKLEKYLLDIHPRHDFKARVYLKIEGENPTGSFKDRGMTTAISYENFLGTKAVICASTGNTSASAAKYAAEAGMRCFVLVPEGKIAVGKLLQAHMYGAVVIQVKGNFDQALGLVRVVSEKNPASLVNNLHPYRLCGQETAAYEICDELGRAPSYHYLPVGNAGNITAYWAGYNRYRQAGKINSLNSTGMRGYQAEGAAPIVKGKIIENPETVASAIRIGNPVRWEEAKRVRKESCGIIDSVTDDEILRAYKLIWDFEEIFCEPSSATSVAGLIKDVKMARQYFWEVAVVVCTLTGHGSKDPDTAAKVFAKNPLVVDPTPEAVMDVIRSK